MNTSHPGRPQSPAGTTPQPRAIHALILLLTSSLSVLVTAILGPSLPQMQAHFAATPHVDYLVPLVVTAPMLVMAIVCVWVGLVSDRVGRKRLLVAATVLYGVFGIAPLLLDSLYAILAARLALGVNEAVLMTVSTAMIGDYFSGRQLERYMSLVVTLSATSAFVFNNLGGLLAQYGWRAPYVVYAVSIPLAIMMLIHLWEPTSRGAGGPVLARHDDAAWRPRLLAGIAGASFLVGLAFLVTPINFAFLFDALGVSSLPRIGVAFGLNSLSLVIGTLLFGWVLAPRVRVAYQLALAAGIAGLGFMLMAQATTYGGLAAAGMVNGLGCGLMLPAVVTWSMRSLPFARRGLGTGATQSMQFFGMFASPLLVVGLQDALHGTRAQAVALVGAAALALAVAAVLAGLWTKRSAAGRPLAAGTVSPSLTPGR